MNNSSSSKHDENANTQMVGSNGPDELSNYAQDALKEVLGWYGLQEGAEGGHRPVGGPSTKQPELPGHSVPPTTSTVDHSTTDSHSPSKTSGHQTGDDSQSRMVVKHTNPRESTSKHFTNGRCDVTMLNHLTPNSNNNPIDLTNGHASGVEMTNTNGSSGMKSGFAGHRKLIGMRFLFPPLSDDLPLYERAKMWVLRHDYKYFVGWTEEELQSVDPALRPICPVTVHMYKLHMNRSEYCRNVKLKYCLESDAPWAQEFRMKIKKPGSEGGFTGLCQAKIAAAELWRKYSENYRSHQARYPNPKSRYRSKRSPQPEGATGNESDTSSKRKSSAEDSIDFDDDGTDDSQEAKRGRLEDEMELLCGDGDEGSLDPSRIHYESDECHEVDDVKHCARSAYREAQLVTSPGTREEPVAVPAVSTQEDPPKQRAEEPVTPTSEGALSGESPLHLSPEQLGSRAFFPHLPHTSPYFGVPLPLFPAQMALSFRTESAYTHGDNPLTVKISGTSTETITTASQGPCFAKPKQSDRHQHEYKRSERGLSFLFPSLSDHNLSLMDKVRVTVLRHKNNYFLGMSEAELSKVDPLVRPKMVVTTEIYKEYCHRNAMKYDSNLQFAMESPEPWAQEFRAKLLRPPSEGGFSSLCEVKLEAGRLWREYSGKYRMHNIVKWQMDLNSATKGPKQETMEPVPLEKSERSDRPRSNKSSHSSVEITSPLPISPTEPIDHDPRASTSSKILSPQSSIESMDLSPSITRSMSNLDFSRQMSFTTMATSPSPKAVFMESASRAALLTQVSSTTNTDQPVESHTVRLGSDSSSGSSVGRKSTRTRDTVPGDSVYSPTRSSAGQRVTEMHTEDTTSRRTTTPLSPTEVFRPKQTEAVVPDVLFKPLPRSVDVAEQLSIWLERHRHNYFLGYKLNELSSLSEFIRPNVEVTDVVFKKYIPESMVDVLSKIELIMMSAEPWALEFQEKVHKSTKEGGFSSFEEALTEAVVLWNMAKTTYQHQLMMRESQTRRSGPRLESKVSPRFSPVQTHDMPSPSHRPIKTEDIESPGASSSHSQQGSSTFRYHLVESGYRSTQPAHKSTYTQSRPAELPLMETTPSKTTERCSYSRESSDNKLPHCGKVDKPAVPVLNPFTLLWDLRSKLQELCQDNPQVSWYDRLQAHLPTLRANLGSSYILPATSSECLLDFVLASIHEQSLQRTSITCTTGQSLQDLAIRTSTTS